MINQKGYFGYVNKTVIAIVTVLVAALILVIIVAVTAGDDPGMPNDAAYVRLTVSGASFSPVVELGDGSDATVVWYVEETDASYDGLSPTFVFKTQAVRHVRMTAAYPDGTDAFGDVVTFNVGFDHTQDAGEYNIGSGYDYPVQPVSGIDGVNRMTGLVRFLAATPTLSGALDFTGMQALEYIECYGAKVSSVDLTGCTGLVRLCMENNDLAVLDLNPVSDCLRDLRLSGNQSTVTFVQLRSPMKQLYHYCAQGETVIHHPLGTQLPVIEEWWDWNSGQAGELRIRSDVVNSVITSQNAWTSADLINQFPEGRNGYFEAHSCRLASINLAGCAGLTYLDIHNNLLQWDDVDAVLADVSSWETFGGVLDLSENATPSNAGMAYVYALRDRNWIVTVEPA